MSSKKEFWIAISLFVFLYTVTEPATGCQPAYETIVTNFTSNATHLIMYSYPKCPPNYVVGRVLAAEARTASSSKGPFNITGYLSPKLSSCGDTGAASCVFYNPPKDLVNSSATAIGNNTRPEIVVNYTCQAKSIFRGGYMTPSQTRVNTSTDSVTYILTEMTGFGQDWSCTLSSSSEMAVRWWSAVAAASWSCRLDQSLKCSGGNGSDIITTARQNATSDLCMKAQSIVLIRFFADTSCTNILDILLDVQVQRGSELDMRCSSEPPPNPSVTTALDLMKANCSALLWTAPTGRTTASLPTPTSGHTILQSIPTTVTSSPVLGVASPEPVVSGTDVHGLAMGLGLGLGVFVVLVAIVIAVVCLRKSSRSKRESKANLNCSEAAADDAGFVPADDVFTCKSFYHRPETPDNGTAHVQAIHQSENNPQSSVPDILLPPSNSPASPPPPSSSEPGKGKGIKQPRTLTKKVFTQIAEAAKQEERKNRKSKRKSVANKGNGRAEREAEVDCEPSYADVWLYSSTLSGINSAVDCVAFPPQSATEL